jgi:MFS family permease
MSAGTHQQGETGGLFRTWAIAFLGAAVLIVFDPLGLSETADRLSERILLAVSAPLVSHIDRGRQTDTLAADPEQPPPTLRPGSRITVILVDDAFMAAYRRSEGQAVAQWPIPRRDQYELLLEPILDRSPRALFIDWVWHQDGIGEEGELQALAESLRQFHAFRFGPGARTPLVLMADRPPRSPDDRATGSALRWTDPATIGTSSHLAEPMALLGQEEPWAARVATRWYGRADRYPLAPLRLVAPGDAAGNRQGFAAGDLAIASPALALFRAECEAAQSANSLCERIGSSADADALGFAAVRLSADAATEMARLSAPQWLSLQSPAMRAIRRNTDPGHPCLASEQAGVWRTLLASLRLRRTAGEEEVPFNPCIAIDTVSARDLGTITGEGLSPAALDRLLSGRLILLGVDLDTAPDRVTNPVNGSVPAVLLHATVLENMLASGRNRLREPPEQVGPVREIALIAALLLAAIAAIPATEIASGQLDRPHPSPKHAGPLFLLAALLAPAAGLALGPAAAIPASVVGAILLFAAARLAPEWGSGLALLGVMLGGILLPLSLALLLFFWTDWAPANWVSGFTAKLFMIGGASAILSKAARIGRLHARFEGPWRLSVRPLFVAPFVLVGVTLAALLYKSEVLSSGAVSRLLLVATLVVILALLIRISGWRGLALLVLPVAMIAAQARWSPFPDDGLMLAVGWGLTLAFLPLTFVAWAIVQRLKPAG